MNALLIAAVSKIVEIVLKYLIAWGEQSIKRQQAIKEKMEAHKANLENGKKKAEAYEQNPNADTRDDVP